jgi:hypothetical protein
MEEKIFGERFVMKKILLCVVLLLASPAYGQISDEVIQRQMIIDNEADAESARYEQAGKMADMQRQMDQIRQQQLEQQMENARISDRINQQQ